MAKVKLESRKPMTVAYVEYVGDYGKIPFDKYIPMLYGWAKANKVMPGFYPMGIFHSDPSTTPPGECRADVGIAIYSKAKPSREIKIRKFQAMKVAALSHKGPASEYAKSYETLTNWIREKGYQWAGDPIELYSKKPEVVGGKQILYAKILAPVKKKTSSKKKSVGKRQRK